MATAQQAPQPSADGLMVTYRLEGSATAGELVARLASLASLRDISVQEPDIEDVIARLYASGQVSPAPGVVGSQAAPR